MTESGAAEGAIRPLRLGLPISDDASSRRERNVVRAAQKGSPDAVEALVEMFWMDAKRIALAVTADSSAAEDVAQESLLAAIRGLSDFDRRRPFRPWLYRITTNKAIDWVRARERRGETELSQRIATAHETTPAPPAGLSDEALLALLEIEPRARAAIVLRYLIGLNSGEIGEVLELSDGTVRSLIHRALERLRSRLEDVDE
jgi:RNA polymerase sigma factor (sigma-70 family)